MIGNMRHRIDLYEPTEVIASDGSYVPTYALYGVVWGAVSSQGLAEPDTQLKRQEVEGLTITIWYESSIKTDWVIHHNSTPYNVKTISHDDKNTYTTLGVSNG